MGNTGDERRMAKNAEDILTFLIAKNENIPLKEVDKHVEEELIKANEKGLIKYETKSVKSV